MRSPTPFSLTLSAVLLSCGAGQSGPQEPPSEAPAESEKAPESPPESSDSTPGAGEAFSADEEAALAAIEASELDEPEGSPQREILYRLTQQGLHVELEGADFAPRAKSQKVQGGLGLELTVRATATNNLVLLAPADGPLAFGGKVTRASGQVDKFGDRRKDGSTVPLGPETPQTLRRTWPIAGVAPLEPGDELELQVGLWGLGPSESDRRPVRKFVVIKMKASKEGGMPIIEPPAQ